MTSKYVIVDVMGLPGAILLPESAGIAHADVAKGLKVVAAGFCERTPAGKWRCWGGSVSLGVNSRLHRDEEVLELCYERKAG